MYSKNGTLSVYNSTIPDGSGGSGRELYDIGIGCRVDGYCPNSVLLGNYFLSTYAINPIVTAAVVMIIKRSRVLNLQVAHGIRCRNRSTMTTQAISR